MPYYTSIGRRAAVRPFRRDPLTRALAVTAAAVALYAPCTSWSLLAMLLGAGGASLYQA